MYLVSQLWWYLLLAFLLGVLFGYLIWRYCGRRRMLSELASGATQTKSGQRPG